MKFISPKYKMVLVPKVVEAIKNEFDSYQKMNIYLQNWHKVEYDNYNNENIENFYFMYNEYDVLDYENTLHKMPDDILLKIAIEMGVDTPGFIPSYPTFKNELKSDYNTAFQSFEKAYRNIGEDPDLAVGLANSTLEGIIKHILEDKSLKTKALASDTLYKLSGKILKEFSMFPNGKNSEMPEEINNIGSSLLNISQNIEGLRSRKTNMHGKAKDDYVLNDSLYAYFIVNSITTVGMFLKSFYETKYEILKDLDDDGTNDLPF